MGAFGAARNPHININDGHIKLKEGKLKSEQTLTLFEEGTKNCASQHGQRAFGSKRSNVDQIEDSHKYKTEINLNSTIPMINKGLLTHQDDSFGNIRSQVCLSRQL